MRGTLSALICLALGVPVAAQNVQHGLRVPAGFEVVEVADSQLANDIFTLTINPRGQVVVSGPGYLRILVQDEKTGKATRAIDIGVGNKDGAQGLFWEGDLLYYMADGGLRRIRVGEDGKAAGSSELVRAMKTGGEHHAHAIKRGPDGWLYVLAGNTAGIDKSYARLATSPIKEPVAGCLIRLSPDLKNSEIVADGFRNAYDFDFNLDGEAFTFDSDNERCVSLPWYEGTRFYHVIPGGHYGWQAPQHGTFFRLPPYMPDVVPPLMDLGRGSPTGVACYRHAQFPEEYRGGIFLADWTFGRIFYMRLKRSGASYSTEKEVFLQSTGDNGFAPTAVVVNPKTGDLYVSIGGRGTRGGVYRIRYPQGAKIDPTALAKMKMASRSLEWKEDYVKQARGGEPPARLQSLIELRRNLGRLKSEDVLNAIRANWDHDDREICRAAADLIAVLPQRERQQLNDDAKKPRQQATWCLGCAVADPDTALRRAEQHYRTAADRPGRSAGTRRHR
jgi:glucose/arabinose dehydrogenase